MWSTEKRTDHDTLSAQRGLSDAKQTIKTPVKVARVAGRCYYLGPNKNAPAMRLADAKEAFKRLANLESELHEAVAYSKASGHGDHAKISRLDAEIARIQN